MFDWLEYDEKMKKEYTEQEERLQMFLKRYLEKNSEIRQMPIYERPGRETLEKIASIGIPARGRDPLEVGDELVTNVFEQSMLIQHPRFFSFVASAVSPYSLAGAILTDIYNPNGGAWELSPGAAMIEEKLIKWMGSCAGYRENTVGGIFMSGGSMANMSAMVAARDAKLTPEEFGKGVVYMSDQTHSSNAKGLRIIGFRSDQVVRIPTDGQFRIRTDLLEAAIKADLEAGKKPFAVIGSLGTTNTGSIDPLHELGVLARRYGLWFHVDGAFGGSVLLSPIYRNLAWGVELSDSLSWDTHKWLMQTYSCSSLIVKDRQNLLNSFMEHPEYLEDVRSEEHADGWDLGPEMSRPHRAVKLWYTIQATGTDLLAELVEYSFHNAKLVETELKKLPNWEIISAPCCGTINFRYVLPGLSDEELNRLNERISGAIIQSGFAFIVTTTLKNRRTLRMCTINANTTEDDVLRTVAKLNELAVREAACL